MSDCASTSYEFVAAGNANLPADFDFTDQSIANLRIFYDYVASNQCCGDTVVLNGSALAANCDGTLTADTDRFAKRYPLSSGETDCTSTGNINDGCDLYQGETVMFTVPCDCCAAATDATLDIRPMLACDCSDNVTVAMTKEHGEWRAAVAVATAGWHQLTVRVSDGETSHVLTDRKIRVKRLTNPCAGTVFANVVAG